VQFEVGRGDAGGQGLLKPPQHRPDAGGKLARAERLGDVVVGAKVQPANAVFFTRPGSEKDYWNAGKITAFPDLPADIKTAAAGHHDIKHEEDRRMLARQWQNVIAGSAKADIESAELQVVADQVADVRVIFEDNDILLHVNTSDLCLTIVTNEAFDSSVNR
jgi:hypothetical protein